MDGVVFDVFECHGVFVGRAAEEGVQEAEGPADVAVDFAVGAEGCGEAGAAEGAEAVFCMAEGEAGVVAFLGIQRLAKAFFFFLYVWLISEYTGNCFNNAGGVG